MKMRSYCEGVYAPRIAVGITMLVFFLLAGSATSMLNSRSGTEYYYSNEAIYNIDRALNDNQTPMLSPYRAEMAQTNGLLDIPHENGLLDTFHISGMLEANGTHFEINNSSYLNVTLDSSEPINLNLESVPEMVTLRIESATGAASAKIILGGFLPHTTYHIYEDDYHNHTAFNTDSNGNYVYTQDLSKRNLVFIQPIPSTRFINTNANGGDCASIGTWNSGTKTCTLTIDLTETVQIDSDGITLDGGGHTITGSGTGSGILISGRTGLTIKNLNINNFTFGIYLESSSNNNINGNNVSKSSYGIYLDLSGNNTLYNNTAFNNLSQSGSYGSRYGIYLNSSSGNILNNNTASNILGIESVYGIYLGSSSNNTLSNNTASNNGGSFTFGIVLGSSNSNILSNNTVSNNNGYGGDGIVLRSSNSNILSNNTASNNIFDVGSGISLINSIYNTLSNNIASENSCYGFELSSSNNNKLSNNTASYNWAYGVECTSGIILGSSNNNTLNNNNISNNSYSGIYLYSSSNNTLNTNTVSNNYAFYRGFGIELYSSGNNTIYNNIFNNTKNSYFENSNINSWNTMKQLGTNIIGGPYLGGNFWAYPNGTGFSQTCKDVNNDWICDTSYSVATGNIDYHPLVQLGYINGTVKNNSIGIAGTVVTTNTSNSNTTDASGFYSILVHAGAKNLIVTKEPGYYPNTSVIVIATSGTTIEQDIELIKKPTGNISGSVSAN